MTTTRSEPDDDIVILGVLPDPPHTHRALVAHPRPGFIAPTATAGGDAPPTTHTRSAPAPARMASTTAQRQPTPLTFTAFNLGETLVLIAMTTVVLAFAVVALVTVADKAADVVLAVAGFAVVSAVSVAVSYRRATRRQRNDRAEHGIR